MNRNQVTIIFLGMAICLGMFLFPPWRYTVATAGLFSERPGPYCFFFTPPPPIKAPYPIMQPGYGVHLDLTRLGAQWLIIVLVCAGAVLALKERRTAKDLLQHAKHTSFIEMAGHKNEAPVAPAPSPFETSMDASPPPAFARDDDQVE